MKLFLKYSDTKKRLGNVYISLVFPQNSGSIMYSGDEGVSELKRDSLHTGGGGAVGIPLDDIY